MMSPRMPHPLVVQLRFTRKEFVRLRCFATLRDEAAPNKLSGGGGAFAAQQVQRQQANEHVGAQIEQAAWFGGEIEQTEIQQSDQGDEGDKAVHGKAIMQRSGEIAI